MKLNFNSRYLILLLFIPGIFSCNDDDDCCLPVEETTGNIWIVNEGLFLQNNASLDIFNATTSDLSSGVFATANGRSLGDIAQSIVFHDKKAYVIVNNSQRIEVIDETDYTSIATITDNMVSPRYGLVWSDKLYVSDMAAPQLHVIDPTSNAVVEQIDLTHPAEQIIQYNNLIYATSNSFTNPLNHLYVIDPNQGRLIDSIEIGLNPNAMTLDASNMIWVMCDGVFGQDSTSALYRINPRQNSIDKVFTFDNFRPAYPTRLIVNADNPRSIYINGSLGLYKMDMENFDLPTLPFIQYVGGIYGIGIDPDSGRIYIGDSEGFTAEGSMSIYDPNGTLIETMNVGFLPSQFYFR